MTTPDPTALAKSEADAQLATANDWAARLGSFVIQSDDDEANIVNVLQEVKARAKTLENRRTEITQPLNQALRSVNALFKPAQQKFDQLERHLKGLITTYMQAKNARNVAAIQAAAVAPTPVVAQQVLAQVQPVEAPANVSVRYVWQFQITQPELVPAQFLSPDPAKIQAYLAQTNQPAIPGVTFSQKAITSVRSR